MQNSLRNEHLDIVNSSTYIGKFFNFNNTFLINCDACAHVLDVRESTCTGDVYAELGRLPLL